MNIRGVVFSILAVAGGIWVQGAWAQKASCSVDSRTPSDADMARFERRWADSEGLYKKMLAADPSSDEAMAGLVLVELNEDKLDDALALAQADVAAHPKHTVLLDALGVVRFRRGEVGEAGDAFNQAMQLDLCNGWTHYEMYRYFKLSGMYATAQRRLDTAHALSPQNPWIQRAWQESHAVPMTSAQSVADLKKQLENSALKPEEKAAIQARIKGIETFEKGDCKLASPVAEAKFTLMPIWYEASYTPDEMYAVGLDIAFNGKKKRLEVDTGASGITLSRAAAQSAGLVPELETRVGGIGDEGASKSYVTHVDDIKIGNMEFKNCMVEVLEKDSDLTINADGLIGPDVFSDYLVTLDIPQREMRLGPLPKRPDETAPTAAALNTDAGQPQVSQADRAKDRYIAPEMKTWTPVFRYDHMLILPTHIGNAPVKLFVMDTGAAKSMISPAAASEVTHVARDRDREMEGLSGKVNNISVATNVELTFAGIKQMTLGMDSFASGSLFGGSGVEISGLIGFPVLRELEISIDYRDNLVHVNYDPRKGHHILRPD